jgi:asparagine synthase (glutamine-hydrolysing)
MRGILPEQIRNRMDKLGFVTPEQIWVCESKPELFKKKIEKITKKHATIFNSNTVKIAYDIIDGRRRYSSLPWRIISFGTWMDQFNVQCQ